MDNEEKTTFESSMFKTIKKIINYQKNKEIKSIQSIGDLYFEKQKFSPACIFSKENSISIKGTAIESPKEFSNLWYDWLDKYLEEPKPTTCISINLVYLNNEFRGFLHNFLVKFVNAHKKGITVVNIIWYYDDEEDMIEERDNTHSYLDISIKYIKV